ncbi:nicotinate-nucleotide adenylyltransferase [Flavivirga eckloniae]|uniref:Nicotinate-nucleotide adenylyltransferase n=1 Tax=Flavivirga eckloniae TaxID=1803846 RepID=A0A2K9PKF6_9FLAO|nr:nicotinate-nucleotide adenylyltransferase [Flavivirga eckloniae]AUP77506.1 nicotinate-nucleotide adenylyltransferase [Flavivirga eckloniae]
MKKLLLGIFIFGLTLQGNSQTIELANTVISTNYEYLDAIDLDNAPNLVKKLETAILNFDKNDLAKLYDKEFEIYEVTFFVPEGKIVAIFDKEGKIIRTTEKYNNVKLPQEVLQAISKRYPNWGIVQDNYLIKYHRTQDSIEQIYRVKIKNDNKTMRLKTDENGIFL